MTMFCTSCGKKLPDDTDFCIYCGSPVSNKGIIKKKNNYVTEVESTKNKYGSQSEKKTEGGSSFVVLNGFIRFAVIATIGVIICVLIIIAINKSVEKNTSSAANIQTTDATPISSSQASNESTSNNPATRVMDEYIIPDSDKVLLKENDVKNLSAQQLTYARNEIYARHGYVFNSEELNIYFREKSWYSPLGDNSKIKLNSTEEANTKLIKDYQDTHGLSYTLDSSSASSAGMTNSGYIPKEFEVAAQSDLVKKGDYFYLMPKFNVPIKSYDGAYKVDYSFKEGIKIAKDAKVGVAVKCEPGGDQAVYTYEYYNFYDKVEELFNKSHWKNTKDGLMFSVNGTDIINMVLIQVNTQGEIVVLKDYYNP